MKKEIKGFILGVVVTAILMSSVAMAQGVKKTIEVVFNGINLEIYGNKAAVDNILYNGTTYVSIRQLSNFFDYQINWNKDTNTASLSSKKPVIPSGTPVFTPAPTPMPTIGKPSRESLYFEVQADASVSDQGKYAYWKISEEKYTFNAGDYIEYDVYINDKVAGFGGIEIFNTDGTYFRDQKDWVDQNGLSGHPATDISALVYKKWYHRKLPVPTAMVGKTSSDFDLAVINNASNKTFSAYFDNIFITNSGRAVKVIYKDGLPSANASKEIGTGYKSSVKTKSGSTCVPDITD